jgi:hypothetical protein
MMIFFNLMCRIIFLIFYDIMKRNIYIKYSHMNDKNNMIRNFFIEKVEYPMRCYGTIYMS